MRRFAALAVVLAALASPLAAQNTAEAMLQRAKRLYDDVEVERALEVLRQVLSPSNLFTVSPEQRVTAYKYIGAALALQPRMRDSAVVYFRAAIERDPFVDLEPQSFSPGQIAAFVEARRQTFAVAVRPQRIDSLAPGTERVVAQALTTHSAAMHVEQRLQGGGSRVLYDGNNDGLREVRWDGLLGDGSLAPSGRYELDVIGRSRLLTLTDTATVYLDVVQLHAPLEDTLPDLGSGDLLPEQYPMSVATGNLLKGLGVAAAAFAIQAALPSGSLGGGSALLPGAVAGAGALTGVVSFAALQRNRAIPTNIAVNEQRRAERQRENAARVERNAAKMREARLRIAPAGGGR